MTDHYKQTAIALAKGLELEVSTNYDECSAYCPYCEEMTTWTEVHSSDCSPAGGEGPSSAIISVEPGCEHFYEVYDGAVFKDGQED